MRSISLSAIAFENRKRIEFFFVIFVKETSAYIPQQCDNTRDVHHMDMRRVVGGVTVWGQRGHRVGLAGLPC